MLVGRDDERARLGRMIEAARDWRSADVIAGALANAGLPPGALEPAEAAGLLTLRRREIEFDHPLVSAAVYRKLGIRRRGELAAVLAA